MRFARSIVVAAFAAAALPAAAQEVTLKVHHFWPPGAMPPSQLLVQWCDKIAKDSGNRLKCQIYPAMQLGARRRNSSTQAVAEALKNSEGNKTRASKTLGISRKALYKRLRDANLT